jgi:hypothetical protein
LQFVFEGEFGLEGTDNSVEFNVKKIKTSQSTPRRNNQVSGPVIGLSAAELILCGLCG